MKRKILTLIGLILILAGVASAQWKYNPFFWMGLYKDQTVGLATLASPSFTGTVKSAGPLELGPLGRNLKTWWEFNDFISGPSGSALGTWQSMSSGTGAAVYSWAGTALRPGITHLDVGTTTTGYSSIFPNYMSGYMQPFLFGAGTYTIEADVLIGSLSTTAETYTLRFGFGDMADGTDFVDGAYYEYTDVGGGTPTPNWYKCTASNSTRTKTDTTVAAVVAAWTRLKVVVNSAGTSVEYFINGVSVGVVTTNIPTGTGRETGVVLSILKSAGTTSTLIRIDWSWIHIDLTTSR